MESGNFSRVALKRTAVGGLSKQGEKKKIRDFKKMDLEARLSNIFRYFRKQRGRQSSNLLMDRLIIYSFPFGSSLRNFWLFTGRARAFMTRNINFLPTFLYMESSKWCRQFIFHFQSQGGGCWGLYSKNERGLLFFRGKLKIRVIWSVNQP